MRVFDAFIFFNELDVLRIRLEELKDVVDRFVLIESPVNFAGSAKPLYFSDHQEEFVDHSGKLRSFVWPGKVPPRLIEREQRNFIYQALVECGAEDDDIVIISDVDEIPRAASLERMKSLLVDRQVVSFVQAHHPFFLNWRETNEWCGSVAVKFSELKRQSPDQIRWGKAYEGGGRQRAGCNQALADEDNPQILNGGWHLSWQGGPDAVRYKTQSYLTLELRGLQWLRSGMEYIRYSDGRANLQNNRRNELAVEHIHRTFSLSKTPLYFSEGFQVDLGLPLEVRSHPLRYTHLFRFENAMDDSAVSIPTYSLRETIRRKLRGAWYTLQSPLTKARENWHKVRRIKTREMSDLYPSPGENRMVRK